MKNGLKKNPPAKQLKSSLKKKVWHGKPKLADSPNPNPDREGKNKNRSPNGKSSGRRGNLRRAGAEMICAPARCEVGAWRPVVPVRGVAMSCAELGLLL
jgi:hypothetical protein